MHTETRFGVCLVLGVCWLLACSSSGPAPVELRPTTAGAPASNGGGQAAGGEYGFGGSGGNVLIVDPSDPCKSAAPPITCQMMTAEPGCGDGKINQAKEACDDGNS